MQLLSSQVFRLTFEYLIFIAQKWRFLKIIANLYLAKLCLVKVRFTENIEIQTEPRIFSEYFGYIQTQLLSRRRKQLYQESSEMRERGGRGPVNFNNN